jgi:hypothetical protein
MDKSTPKGPNYRKWYAGESYLHQDGHDRRNAKRFLDGKELRSLHQMCMALIRQGCAQPRAALKRVNTVKMLC